MRILHPRFLVVISALLEENPQPNDDEIKCAIEGNLCRCTGYQQIVDSVKAASDILISGETTEDTTSAKSDPDPNLSEGRLELSDKKRVEGYRQQSGKLPFARPGSGGSRGTSKPRDEEAIAASKAATGHRHDNLITGSTIGKSTGLIDSRWKVTGRAQYGDDIRLPGRIDW